MYLDVTFGICEGGIGLLSELEIVRAIMCLAQKELSVKMGIVVVIVLIIICRHNHFLGPVLQG